LMGGSNETVLQLTPEEMAAVDRLAEMGFDRAEAAQAFLACDKNEALAANLLMDSMNDVPDDALEEDDDDNMYD
jgi:UV excision repair protein RAD23